MFERSIGIKLELLPAFADATKSIVGDIKKINTGLKSISTNGENINVEGLKTLQEELANVATGAIAAKTALEQLSGIKLNKNVLSALKIGVEGVIASSKKAVSAIQEVEGQTEQLGEVAQATAVQIENANAKSGESFFKLSEEIMLAEKALAKLGLFAHQNLNGPIVGMRSLGNEISLAERALQKLDTFRPTNLEQGILRLNSGMQNLLMLTAANPLFNFDQQMRTSRLALNEIKQLENQMKFSFPALAPPRQLMLPSTFRGLQSQYALQGGITYPNVNPQLALPPGRFSPEELQQGLGSGLGLSGYNNVGSYQRYLTYKANNPDIQELPYGAKPIKLKSNMDDLLYKNLTKGQNLNQLALGPGLSDFELLPYKRMQKEQETIYRKITREQAKKIELLQRIQAQQEGDNRYLQSSSDSYQRYLTYKANNPPVNELPYGVKPIRARGEVPFTGPQPIPGQLALGPGLSDQELMPWQSMVGQAGMRRAYREYEKQQEAQAKRLQAEQEAQAQAEQEARYRRANAEQRLRQEADLGTNMRPMRMGGEIGQYGGLDVLGTGRTMMQFGDKVQSLGHAAAMNAFILGTIGVPMIQHQADILDLTKRTNEAYQGVGMNPSGYDPFNQAIMRQSSTIGGDLRENIGAGYVFASSVPTLSNVNWNDPKQNKLMQESFGKMIKTQVVGSSSTHPINMEHLVLDTLATVTNLGLPNKSAAELAHSIDIVTDMFVRIKNKTATEIDLLASSFRNIGPIAANQGINQEQVEGLLIAEAEGKIRGGQAGNFLKRIMSRQAMTPKQAREMEGVVSKYGGNVSMYDKQGNVRNMFDFFADVGKFEKQHNLPAKQRAELEGALSGLYAGPGFGEIVRFITDAGGSKAFEAQVQKVLHQGQGREEAYQTRTEGNLQFEAKTAMSAADTAMQGSFKIILPDLIKVLHGVRDLISAWSALPAPIQKVVLESVGFVGVASALTGVSLILGGNFVKLAGAATAVAGGVLTVTEHLLGTQFVTLGAVKGFQALKVGIIESSYAAVPRLAAIALAMGPIGLAVIAIIATVGLLTVAWNKDFGGMQEKLGTFVGNTRAWFDQIPQNFKKSCDSCTQIWNNMLHGTSDSTVKWLNSIGDIFKNWKWQMPDIKIKMDFDVFGNDQYNQSLLNIGKGNEKFNKANDDAYIKAREGNTTPGVYGVSPIDIFSQRQSNNANTGFLDITHPAVQSAVRKVIGPTLAAAANLPQSNLEGTIKPTGSNQGTAGTPGGYGGGSAPVQSSAAAAQPPGVNASDLEVANAIDALFGGKSKSQKAINDGFLVLKTKSVSEVEDMAKKIEAALRKAGAKIKDTWIDILDPKTFKVTRVFGDIGAYKQALGSKDKDNTVQIAKDYLQKIEREIKQKVPVNTEKVLANMAILYSHATTDHAREVISQITSIVTEAFHRSGDKIEGEFNRIKTKLDSQLQTVNRAADRFDLVRGQQDEKVQKAQSAIKDSSAPTVKEMLGDISAETQERNALASILLTENEDYKNLAITINNLTNQMHGLSDSNAYEHAEKERLKDQLDEVNRQYDAATTRMQQQQQVVDGLTESIQNQNEALKTAKGTWAGFFNNIYQNSTKALQGNNFKAIADHVQNYFQLQNSPKGSAGNSPNRQNANNYANTVIQEAFKEMFDVSATTSLKEIFTKGHKATKKEPATPPEVKEVMKSNEKLDIIAKNTAYLLPGAKGTMADSFKLGNKITQPTNTNLQPTLQSLANSFKSMGARVDIPTGTSSDPLNFTLRPDGGGTDLGQAMSDNLQTATSASTGIFGATPSSFADMVPTQKKTNTSLQDLQTAMGDASNAYNLYNGMRAGGVGGAMEAGTSAYQLTGNVYIAGAAAIIGAIGIGPHETPAQQPDLNDPFYQQMLPNWAGTEQTLGNQVIQPTAQFSTYAGAPNEATQMYNYVNNPAVLTGMNPAQIASIQAMKNLSINSKTGQDMGAAGLAITSEGQGVVTFASGQTMKVQDFDTLVQTDQGLLDSFNNNVLQQQQNADRLASSFTSMVLNGPAGFMMPDLVGGGLQGGGNPRIMPNTNVGNGSTLRTSQSTAAQVNISIMQGATISSTPELQAAIETAIPQIQAAINSGNFQNARTSGSYVSTFT